MLSQKMEEKINEYDMPKLIVGNINIVRQYSAALGMLEENYKAFNIKDLLLHEHLYDSMDIKLEYEYKDENKKVVKSISCNNEILVLEPATPGSTLE